MRVWKNDSTYFKWIFGIKLIFWTVFVFYVVLMFLFQMFEEGGEGFFRKNEIQMYQGFRVVTENEEIPVQVPSHVDWEPGKEMILKNQLPNEIADEYHLFVCGVHQDVQVWIGDELRTVYSDVNTRTWGKSSQTCFLRVPLSKEDAGKEVTIHLVSWLISDSGEIGRILLGSDSGFYYFMIQTYGKTLAVAVIMIIVGLVFILFALIVNLIYGKKQGAHYLGAFALVVGCSILCDSHLRQFYFSNIPAAANLCYVCVQLCAIPLLCFLDELQQYRFKIYYIILKTCFLINWFVCFVLQACEIVDYGNSIYTTHILILISTGVVCYCFIQDMREKKRTEVVETFIALFAIVIFAMLEIYNSDVINSPVWGQYISTGVLLFLIIISFTTLNQMQRREYESYKAIEENEAKTMFLASMSHEIRTPLNVVLGMDEMILRESNSEQLTGYAEAIRDSGTTLLYLINNILDYSKTDSGKMEVVKVEFDLRDFLDNLCAVGNVRLKKNGITFLIKINRQTPRHLFGDEQHIRQIVINFLSNAIKYTMEGCVTLVVDFVDRGKNICLDICVKDTGVGIREEEQGSLFDAFTRVDIEKNRGIEGTGLGLSIAKNLADLLGGEIYFQSEYEKGSEFGFRIELKKMDEEVIGEYKYGMKSDLGRLTHRGFIAPECSILIVDDNSMNLEVMKELLKKTGMEIDTAESGAECLERMIQKKYHVILLDHMMPGMDGIETLQKAKGLEGNLNMDTPVIAVTANAVAGARELFLHNGFRDFVAKPVDYKKLEETLLRYLPEELVFRSDLGQNVELLSSEEMERLGKELRSYDIQMKEGLRYTGGDVYQYAKFLEMFIRSYPKLSEDLKQNLRKKTMNYYIIKIHSLKGNAKSIGAMDLFYTAQRMENRGKQGDYAYIKQANHLLKLELERAKQGAEMFLNEIGFWSETENTSEGEKKTLTQEMWKENLSRLLEYIQELQASEAKKLIQELEKFQLVETQILLCKQVTEQLDDMEYENAERLITEYDLKET